MKLVSVIPHCDWVPERRLWVSDIRRELPEAVVVKDMRRGLWDTHRRAWRYGATTSGATHVLLIQDDMLPCRNFRALLHGAVEARPDAAVNLFCARPKSIAKAQEAEVAWIRQDDNIWGATILRSETVLDFLDWEPTAVRADYDSDDRRLMAYCYHVGLPVLTTCPSLVLHAGHKSSLIGHSGGRFREVVAFSDGSPIDWNTGEVKLPVVASRREVIEEIGTPRYREWLYPKAHA